MPRTIKNQKEEDITTGKHTDYYYSRLDQIVLLILENDHYMKTKANRELTDKVCELLNCGDRQAQHYIADARREIKRLGKEKKEAAFRKVVKHLELVMIRARGESNAKLENPDNKLYLETIKYYAKINGLEVEETKTTGEITLKNVDMSQLTEYGLERVKRGDRIEEVLMDPKSRKQEN